MAPPRRVVSASGVSTRSIAAMTVAAFVAAGLAWFVLVRASAPALPRVESLGAIAPEVADAARQALDSLAADPRDAQRWGRFGMICEANGLVGPARLAYQNATSIDAS